MGYNFLFFFIVLILFVLCFYHYSTVIKEIRAGTKDKIANYTVVLNLSIFVFVQLDINTTQASGYISYNVNHLGL